MFLEFTTAENNSSLTKRARNCVINTKITNRRQSIFLVTVGQAEPSFWKPNRNVIFRNNSSKEESQFYQQTAQSARLEKKNIGPKSNPNNPIIIYYPFSNERHQFKQYINNIFIILHSIVNYILHHIPHNLNFRIIEPSYL